MAIAAGGAERPVTGVLQSRAHAARLRQPAVSRMRAGARVAIVVLVVFIVAAIALIALRPGTLPSGAPAVNATTQMINRGEYLARAGDCVACHTAPGGKQFAGGRAMPTPFGNLYVPNITADDETGIGK